MHRKHRLAGAWCIMASPDRAARGPVMSTPNKNPVGPKWIKWPVASNQYLRQKRGKNERLCRIGFHRPKCHSYRTKPLMIEIIALLHCYTAILLYCYTVVIGREAPPHTGVSHSPLAGQRNPGPGMKMRQCKRRRDASSAKARRLCCMCAPREARKFKVLWILVRITVCAQIHLY